MAHVGTRTCRKNFYPRPPRGGRPEKYRDTQAIIEFLSTPSARRATDDLYAPFGPGEVFLSTPSARRATRCLRRRRRMSKISIHALREEGDLHPAPCRGLR